MALRTAILAVVTVISLVALGTAAGSGNASERYLKTFQHPDGMTVVVAEGDFEPRSTGSYSILIYSNAQPEFPTDDYVCGTIRKREGVVENVLFADVNGDDTKEIVVTIRSVGTGSYLSADAFAFGTGTLALVAAVADLPKNSDCIAALAIEARKQRDKTRDAARQLDNYQH